MRVAICFFGLNRAPHITEDSLISNVISPLASEYETGLFGAFMAPGQSINNARSSERNVLVDGARFQSIAFDDVEFIQQDEFDDAMMLDLHLHDLPDCYGDNHQSIKNIFRSTYALATAYKLATKADAYDAYCFVRPDLYFLEKMDVRQFDKLLKNRGLENFIVTPRWQQWGGLNDRYALCDAKGAAVYANRFFSLPEFLENPAESLHAESYLLWSALRGSASWDQFADARAIRVRATGAFSKEEFQQTGISNSTLARYQNTLEGRFAAPVVLKGFESTVLIERDFALKRLGENYKKYDSEYGRFGEARFLEEFRSEFFADIKGYSPDDILLSNSGIAIGARDPRNFHRRYLDPKVSYDRLKLVDWAERLQAFLVTKGLCHRDINPLNICYTPRTAEFRLVDFSWSSPQGWRFSVELPKGLNPYGRTDFEALCHLKNDARVLWAEELKYYVLIVWKNGRDLLARIDERLRGQFKVLLSCDYDWMAEKFSSLLSQFYGQNLPPGCHKERDIGIGTFRVYVFEDGNPVFSIRDVRGSRVVVNANVFELKQEFRHTTGEYKNVIHASNTPKEGRSDYAKLFGELSLSHLAGLRSLPVCIRHQDANWDPKTGWHSIDDLFSVLDRNIRFVVLRNFQNLPHGYTSGAHGDIDLLVSDLPLALFISKGEYVKNSVHYRIKIKGEYVYFDFRSVGDNYYCSQWSQRILDDRVAMRGFFVPSASDHFYSLLYHALIHKRAVAEDYKKILDLLATSLGILLDASDESSMGNVLGNFLRNMGYGVVKPDDLSVVFNTKALSHLEPDVA